MIAFKAIGASSSFTILKQHHQQPFLLLTRRPPRNHSLLCFSKPTDDSDSDSPPPPPEGDGEGDTRRQELLARIVMLQTEKVRLTDYLDERSDYLTQFAEEATAEIDKIGEDALTRLDEASSRIMEKIESGMQEFEESAEMNRAEIEENENKLVEFEDQIVKDRNEGMFFKSLGTTAAQKAPIDKDKAMAEAQKIKALTKAKAESATRRNIYLALIALLVFTIAESFAAGPDWRKVAVLGAILIGLITQVSSFSISFLDWIDHKHSTPLTSDAHKIPEAFVMSENIHMLHMIKPSMEPLSLTTALTRILHVTRVGYPPLLRASSKNLMAFDILPKGLSSC